MITDSVSDVYRDAQADVRWYSLDALEASRETFRSITEDQEAHTFERFNAEERLRAFNGELARRERVARVSDGTATRHDQTHDQTHDAWTELAKVVKERVSVPEILELAGVPMRRTGTSRGRDEFHGPCPVCRDGVDRLMAWSGTNGRVWCRQCHWSGDVISAASLIVGTGQFRDCVRYLAGLGVPGGR